MVVRAVDFAGARFALPTIAHARSVEKRQFVDVNMASFGKADRKRRFADQALVGEVFACAGHTLDSEVALEMMLNLGGRTSFADFGQVLDDGGEQRGGAFEQVCVDGRERSLHGGRRIPPVEQIAVDQSEEFRIELERLRKYFTVGEKAGL